MAQAMDQDRAWLMSHAIQRYIEEDSWQVAAVREAVLQVQAGKAKLVPHEDVFARLDTKLNSFLQ
jgi:predicted transcriptional regulator